MFDFTSTDFRRIATAVAGAAMFSTLSLVAAVGPARATAPIATSAWQAEVEGQINGEATGLLSSFGSNSYAIATVLVDLDAAGHIMDTRLLRSTGSAPLDRQALAGARATHFPATPSGKPVHVRMNLVFGRTQRAIELGRAAIDHPAAWASRSGM